MKQIRNVVQVSVFLCVCLLVCAAEAERKASPRVKEEQKKVQEERVKAEEAVKKRGAPEVVSPVGQEAIDAQLSKEEHRQRTRFLATTLTLKRQTIRPGEPLEIKFTFKNGADRAFWIDGRKRTPVFEIRDPQGKVILSTLQPEEPSHPGPKDLVNINPGKSWTIFEGKGPAVETPGRYLLRIIYAFYKPEPFEEWARRTWFGTLVYGDKPFEVK